jgi:hypothetical protein
MLAGSKQELQEDGTDYGDTDDRAIAFSAEVNTTLDPPTTDVSTQFGVETGSISNANLNTTGQALGDTAAAVIGAPGMNRWGNTSDPNTTNLKQPTNQSEPNKTYDENRYLLDDEEGFPVNKNQYKVSNGNSKKEESMTSIVKQINELWTKLLSESSVQPQEEQVESLREEDEDISEFDKDEEGALLDDEIAEDEADLDADIEMSKEDLIQKLVDKLNELKDNPEKLDELDEGLLDEVKKMLDDAIGAEEAVGSAIDAANDEKMDELMDDEEAPEDDLMVAGSYMKLESLFSEALKVKTKKGQEKLMESLNTHVGNFYWITSKGNNKDIKDFGMATKVTKDSVTINKKTYPASSHSFIPMRGW